MHWVQHLPPARTWACSEEEEEEEKEEGRGREGEEGGGRGRKEWEETHYPVKKEHLHTPVLGKWRGTVGTFLVSISRHRAVPIPAPQSAAAVLGEPLCLLPQKEEPPAPSSKSTGA